MQTIKKKIQSQSHQFSKQLPKQSYYKFHRTLPQTTKFKNQSIVDRISQNQKVLNDYNNDQKIAQTSAKLSMYRKTEQSLFTQKYLSEHIKISKQMLLKNFIRTCLLLIPFLSLILMQYGFRIFLEITLFSLFLLSTKIMYREIQLTWVYLVSIYILLMIVIADFISEYEFLHTYNSIYFSSLISLSIIIQFYQKLRLNTMDLERFKVFSIKTIYKTIVKTLKYVTTQKFWRYPIIIMIIQQLVSIFLSVMEHNLIKLGFFFLVIQCQLILIFFIQIIDDIYYSMDMKEYSKSIVEQIPLCLWILRLKSENFEIKNLQFASVKHIFLKLKEQKNFLDTKINKPLFNQNTYWDIFLRYINIQFQNKELQVMNCFKLINEIQQKINSYENKKIYEDALKHFNHLVDYYNIKYYAFLIIMHLKNISMIYDIIAKHHAYKNLQKKNAFIQNIDLKLRVLQNLENAKKLLNLGLDDSENYLIKFELHSINMLESLNLSQEEKKIVNTYRLQQLDKIYNQ